MVSLRAHRQFCHVDAHLCSLLPVPSPTLGVSGLKAGFASVNECSLCCVGILMQHCGECRKGQPFGADKQNLVWEFFTKGFFISHLVLILHFPFHVLLILLYMFKQKYKCFLLERLGKIFFCKCCKMNDEEKMMKRNAYCYLKCNF